MFSGIADVIDNLQLLYPNPSYLWLESSNCWFLFTSFEIIYELNDELWTIMLLDYIGQKRTRKIRYKILTQTINVYVSFVSYSFFFIIVTFFKLLNFLSLEMLHISYCLNCCWRKKVRISNLILVSTSLRYR